MQLFNGFHISGSHIGSGDDPQLSTILGELSQFIYQKPQAAPFNEGHQHIDTVGRDNFFLELRVHLGLMDGSRKQTALGNRSLWPAQISSRFAHRQPWVLLPQKRKKLLRLLDAQNILLEEATLMSFTAGFKLAWGMAKELEADGLYSFEREEEERICHPVEQNV